MKPARMSVLILGGGVMQLPALRICRARGWRATVAAREVSPAAGLLADQVVIADLSDPETVVRQARELRDRHGLDGVFTAGTDFSTTVAVVARELGLPGLPAEVARGATDKVQMRSIFRRHRVPSPDFRPLGSVVDCRAAAQALPFPLVVKPVDSMGARAVRRVDTLEQLEEAAAAALAVSRSRRAIAEEYLEGAELSIDAIVHRGRIVICGVADRHIFFPPCFVEMGHTMPTGLDRWEVRRAVEAFRAGVRALGIREGAAKGDLKLTARGPFVGEIAARLSGGYMSGWTFPLSSGVEVTSAALDIAVGLPPGRLAPRRSWVAAERAFISIPGLVEAVEGGEAVHRVEEGEGVREVFYRVVPGDRVVFPTNNMEKCGNVIAAAPERDAAIRLGEDAVRTIFLRLKPNTAETDCWLADRDPAARRAFRLVLPENRRFLETLPPWRGDFRRFAGGAADLSVPLPPDSAAEPETDWHGTRLAAALRQVEHRTGVRRRRDVPEAAAPGTKVLGRVFWDAFLKGGVQGGVYLIDSLIASPDPEGFLRTAARSAGGGR